MKIRLVLAAATVLALASCGTTPNPADDRIAVVASTDVYGSIAEAIGGDLVSVTSIIDSPDQDPHSFEASAQDQLAISKADIVIENGGGYDPFIDLLLNGSGSRAEVLTATDLADPGVVHESEEHRHGEHDHDHDQNEHLWYDLHAMSGVAHDLARILGDLDPEHAETFSGNAEAFAAEIAGLESQLAAIQASGGVVVTEPVPLFLLEDAGLDNRTPAAFTEAIEEGSDVPPRALEDTLDLLAEGDVVLLAYNEQTASPETERARDSAEAAGIPVALFTESLPDGSDYLSWMADNIEAVWNAMNG